MKETTLTPLLDTELKENSGSSIASDEALYKTIQFGKVYGDLQNGQGVNIDALGKTLVEIDEENLGLEKVTLENLKKGWQAHGEKFAKELKEHRIEADPFTVFKWYQIQRKVFQTLGKPATDVGERNKRFREKSHRIKLSETKGFAMCSEYAILSTYIAQRIGEPARLIIGASVGGQQSDQWREAHAFVWIDGLQRYI